jgi:hypothetical protein
MKSAEQFSTETNANGGSSESTNFGWGQESQSKLGTKEGVLAGATCDRTTEGAEHSGGVTRLRHPRSIRLERRAEELKALNELKESCSAIRSLLNEFESTKEAIAKSEAIHGTPARSQEKMKKINAELLVWESNLHEVAAELKQFTNEHRKQQASASPKDRHSVSSASNGASPRGSRVKKNLTRWI